MNQTLYTSILSVMAALGLSLTSCIEDGISSSPADQPVFSTDSLKMGVVFTDQVTSTHRFTVRNPHSKGLNIGSISLSGENADMFRLNVDGMSGRTFSNVEIRANDSIYVFVEATLPENSVDMPVEVSARIDFVTNGVSNYVTVTAEGQDVERLRAHAVDRDVTFSATRPYQIFDSLVVAPECTLHLPAGARLYFHDGASLIVRGTLISEGTVENPVTLCGDRTGNVVTDITFDLMSRQWAGVQFTPSSKENKLTHTNIRNTVYGVIASGDGADTGQPKLTMVNCKLRNSGDMVLEAYDANIAAYGCELAEAANGIAYLQGGRHIFNHCTFANYYLFSAIGGASIQLAHINAETDARTDTPFTAAEFSNCIIYGNGSDIAPGKLDGTQIYLRNCLLKSAGSDDDNFISCLWDVDPLYYTVREEYLFDYRLKPESPAIDAGNPELTAPEAATDAYGLHRLSNGSPDLGAYVFTAP